MVKWFHVKLILVKPKLLSTKTTTLECVSSLTLTLREIFANLTISLQVIVAVCIQVLGSCGARDGFTKKFGGSMVDHTIDCNSFDLNEQKKESPPNLTSRDQWRIVGPPTRDGATIQKGSDFSVTRISFIQINNRAHEKGLFGFDIITFIIKIWNGFFAFLTLCLENLNQHKISDFFGYFCTIGFIVVAET